MNVAALVIAGYAAVVATVSLTWQIYSRRRSRRPDVEVTLRSALFPAPVRSDGGGGAISELVWHVELRVANRGDKEVYVDGGGLELQDRSGRTFVKGRLEQPDTIPGTARPHHSLNLYFRNDALEENGIDVYRKLVGFANLATGETVRSKRTRVRVRPGSVAEFAARLRRRVRRPLSRGHEHDEQT